MSIFSCRDTVRLVSESLDRRLPIGQRLAVRVHLLGCPQCSRFHKQLQFLHRAARTFEAESLDCPDDGSSALPTEVRERIQRALEHENP